ncbi:MAG: anti-sigma factor antagonist [Gaiellaceae bacterium]
MGADCPKFAHPVERELARLFDEDGVAWLYEPKTFVLERHQDGSVREAFTPDFYLPELDVYIECTVMRQALTRRKRRKARKARERNGITVEILFRQDFDRMARRWALGGLAEAARTARVRGVEFENRPQRVGVDTDMEPRHSHDAMTEFRIEVEHPRPGTVVLAIYGDVDLHVAEELRSRLTAAIDEGLALVIDLSAVTFVDSTTLGVLLGGLKRLRAKEGRLRLVAPGTEIRRIFELTMLDRVFDLDATRDEALAAVVATDEAEHVLEVEEPLEA